MKKSNFRMADNEATHQAEPTCNPPPSDTSDTSLRRSPRLVAKRRTPWNSPLLAHVNTMKSLKQVQRRRS